MGFKFNYNIYLRDNTLLNMGYDVNIFYLSNFWIQVQTGSLSIKWTDRY